MQFTQELETGSYVIRSCTPGAVLITEPLTADAITGWPGADAPVSDLIKRRTLTQSAVITPQRLIDNWPVTNIDQLTEQHIRAVYELKPEVVLLGTGTTLRWPSDDIIRSLQERGIGFEVMDTAAACRTYNILMYEGRQVAAALVI